MAHVPLGLLCIPATLVPSEIASPAARHVVSKHHPNLPEDSVDALILCQQNFNL